MSQKKYFWSLIIFRNLWLGSFEPMTYIFHAWFLQIVIFLLFWSCFCSRMRWTNASVSKILTVSECSIYCNLTVCSFLSYLSPSLPTEIAWRDGHHYSTIFMVWGTQKEVYRDQNLQAKMHYATALNWWGIDFGHSVWFSEWPRTSNCSLIYC